MGRRGEYQKGNALLYVLLAIGLLAALTYAYVQDSHDSYSAQSSVQIAESLYSQVNMIKAAVVECVNEYPGGGEDSTSLINGSPNPNNPYPLAPSSTANAFLSPGGCTPPAPYTSGATGCISAATSDDVINLACAGAPAGSAYMFQGTNNQGRFLPPPGGIVPVSAGGSGWSYANNGAGVYIWTTSTGDAASVQALSRLYNQFTTGQASLVGGTVFTAWIQKN